MARPTKREQQYKYVGRPTKLTPEVILKMEQAAGIRATVRELVAYAGISLDTYYRWMKENPKLSERLDDLRQNPFLIARKTIVSNLDKSTDVAFKFLEKEKPEEYADRITVKHEGAIGLEGEHPEDAALRAKYKAELMENIRKRAIEKESANKQ